MSHVERDLAYVEGDLAYVERTWMRADLRGSRVGRDFMRVAREAANGAPDGAPVVYVAGKLQPRWPRLDVGSTTPSLFAATIY